MRKIISIIILFVFMGTLVERPALGSTDMPLPQPGAMVHLSQGFIPAHLLGITIHPDNALQYDFLVYKGDKYLEDDQKKAQRARERQRGNDGRSPWPALFSGGRVRGHADRDRW